MFPPLVAVVVVIDAPPTALVVNANGAAKFAVIVLAASIVTANGFAVPVALPLQPVKTLVLPVATIVAGIAFKLTIELLLKLDELIPLNVLIPVRWGCLLYCLPFRLFRLRLLPGRLCLLPGFPVLNHR